MKSIFRSPPPRIFYEPKARGKFTDEVNHMGVGRITETGVVGDGGKVAVLLFPSVLADSRHGVGCAIGGRPYHIGLSKRTQDFFCRQL